MEMDLDSRVEQGKRFLQTQYEGRKVSLARATITDRKKGPRYQKFHEGKARLTLRPSGMGLEGHLRSMIKKSDAGEEIFYAPTPMSGSMGRKKEQALPNVVVFGDADNGLTADVHARLTELGACLVRSGGSTPQGPKYHVYLLLTKEVPPHELERLNRALKAFIKGDKFDATTLLRVPGTRNHKYPDSPIVTVERYADARHTPENLAKFLDAPEADSSQTSSVSGVALPEVPKGFRFTANKPGYAHVRRYVREWNGKWADPNQDVRRYMAAIVITKEAIKRKLSIDEAYAFALQCEPLLDKQEEENGYSIQKDVAKIWRRETGIKPSGTLTADDILSAHQTDDARNKTSTTPAEPDSPPPVPATFTGSSPILDSRFPFQTPNLDELLSGEYVPLEPTLVPCGSFFLLYAGKSHSLVADRSVGKTLIAIAMVREIIKAGGRVAYFDFEDSPDTFIRDRMMNQYGLTAEQIRNQFLYVGGTVAELDVMEVDEGTKYLAEQIKGWDLVIIDGVSASMGDLDEDADGNKDVDYKKWHKIMVQPFLDQGLATLQLDHSTKSNARAGGTMQKGAKLTGVEYQVRVDGPNGFTIGRTGRVIIEAVKDRVGRISKHRRTTPPVGHAGKDDWPWNDVATFTLTSDGDGVISRAEFDPINYKDTTEAAAPYKPTAAESKIIETLIQHGQPLTKNDLAKKVGGNRQATLKLITDLIHRELIGTHKDSPRSTVKLVPIENAPDRPSPQVGNADLDFSQVDRKPKAARRKLECHRCRDLHDYPEEFLRPDDIGYQPGRRLCRSCAGENIESEDYREPRDGAEWARGIRERIDRQEDTHEDD